MGSEVDMKLDAQEIKQLVSETERKRADWMRAADLWEKDWSLSRYEDSRLDHRELDGVDTVVTPDPFNIVQLLQRFVADEMRVEVPSLSVKEDDDDRSEKIEEFLIAFDRESNHQQGCNHINDKVWQSGVLGRGASQVIWIGDVLPKGVLTRNILPIWRRKLDPRNVGVGRGPYWVDYAYHKYKTTRSEIEQRYPKFKLSIVPDGHVVHGYWNDKYEVVDFWCLHQGAIWHSVVIDGEWAKSPVKTDYPDIPIIEHYADGAPIDDELARSLSILHPIHDLWQMKCDVLSKVATGLMYHYDPLMIARNFGPNDKITAGPGEIIYLQGEQSLDMFRPEPNVPMAQNLLAMIQTGIDQATFPAVTYGEAPGGVQAGFAINNLSQQARSRANTIRNNIEAAMEAENQLVLGLIEAFAPDEGVEIYGRSQRRDRGGPLRLTKKDIKGNYANHVMLIPEQPMDDVQRLLAYSGLIEKGIISRSFFQNRVMNIPVPRDEELRIAAEQTIQMPEIQQKRALRALQKTYKQDDWELLIQGTPLQQVWETEKQWLEQKKAEAEAAKEARRQERMQREMQEMMASMPPGMPPMGPPPMDGSMPPLPPGGPMMPGGMPPLPPDPSMPPGMSPDLQPPGLPGMPPGMAGQMSPDMLGMGGPGAIPGQFDQLMGGPPPSDEDLLAGLMGGGMPPMP
jgi:hypothetical protein